MRIEGRISDDQTAYEVVQGDRLLYSIPLDQVSDKLRAAIKRNAWTPLP